MILSYHPLFEADRNITCAGREPNAEDLAVIRDAQAVILSQGCYQSIYEMARANCPNVFPNYEARFRYPGKIGQIRLFRELNANHPSTEIFSDVALFQKKYQNQPDQLTSRYPLVFKLDWGGEGETVYRIASTDDLQKLLSQIAEFERTGQSGFLLQEFVPAGGRSLRVVVIGQQIVSYWRIQQRRGAFQTSLRTGAVIDSKADPELQQIGVAAVKKLCQETGINLAGFDVIFSVEMEDPAPLLLEINYFFGRKGLGGSEAYYKLLQNEIRAWLAELC